MKYVIDMSLILKQITFKKNIFFLVSLFTFGLVLVNIPTFFIHPRLQSFQEYESLKNWNVRSHATGDFDNDGKKDIVIFTGCAFLSSVSEENIPSDRKCTASGMSRISSESDHKVGQKYIDFSETDWTEFNNRQVMDYAYMGKSQEGKWLIYAESNGRTYISQIDNGVIKRVAEASPAMKLDKFLYSLSAYLFLIGIFFIYASPVILIISILLYALKRIVIKH